MKTADLVTGPQTDALVALARGWAILQPSTTIIFGNGQRSSMKLKDYQPSTNPTQWAELQLEFKVAAGLVNYYEPENGWNASLYRNSAKCEVWCKGETLGLAICKAVIASKWGDTIPDEIWEKV